MKETHDIQTWLASRVTSEEASAASDKPPVSKELADLDARHETALRELLTRPAWPLLELRTLTSHFGLMPLACVARLNEWTTEKFGDLLLEGDETITVNQQLRQRITT